MAVMLGKWKMDHSATENWEAYAAARKFPAEMVEALGSGKMDVVSEMTQDGDTFTFATRYGDHSETITFKLGEKFTSRSMGMEVENIMELEGDVLVGTHTFQGENSSSRRYVTDGKLIVESEVNGVKMKSCYISC